MTHISPSRPASRSDRRALGLATLIAAVLTGQAAVALPITVTHFEAFSSTYNNGNINFAFDISPTVPHSATLISSIGNSSATTAVIVSGTTSAVLFEFQTRHVYDNRDDKPSLSGFDFALSRSYFVFDVIFDTTFSFAADYSATGLATTYQNANLVDLAAGELFNDLNQSIGTANESFVAGAGCQGDYDCASSGSLSGLLLGGHSYALLWEQFIQDYDGSTLLSRANAATASGRVCFAVGTDATCTANVPEPTSLALIGIGLLAVTKVRRRPTF